MGGIPIDKAELLALFLESFFFGGFFVLFGVVLVLFHQRVATNQPQWRALLSVSILMLAMATLHLIIDVVRAMEAFITQANTSLHGASKYYGDLASPLHLAKSIIYGLQTLLGDGVMVWRCYIVYDKRKAIIFAYGPLLLGSAVTVFSIPVAFSRYTPGTEIFDTAYAWITTWVVLTMTINATSTIAIVYRILSRRLPENTQQSILPVVAVIVQSGALYASGVLGLLITYLAKTNGQYAALDVCCPLVGIVFTLIIIQIRVRFGLSSSSGGQIYDKSNTLSGRVSTARGSRARTRGIGLRVKNSRVDAEPSYAMQVRITEERTQYGDGFDMPKVDGEGSAGENSASLSPEHNERVIAIGGRAKHNSREFDHGAV